MLGVLVTFLPASNLPLKAHDPWPRASVYNFFWIQVQSLFLTLRIGLGFGARGSIGKSTDEWREIIVRSHPIYNIHNWIHTLHFGHYILFTRRIVASV